MEGKRVKEKETKINKKTITIISIAVILVIVIGIVIFILQLPKVKKEYILELGTKTELTPLDFIEREKDENNAKFITDMSQINLKDIGEYEIKLEYKGKEHTSKLIIQDTTPPAVEFQDIEKPIGWELNPEDFIKNITDASEQKHVEVLNPQDLNLQEFGEYMANIKVDDTHGNQVEHSCKLTITYIATEFHLELGTQLKKEDIIYDMEKAGESVKQEDIDEINKQGVGEYEIHSNYQGVEKVTKIIIEDTTPPELTLKDITIYIGQTVADLNQFIVETKDASKVTTTILTTPDFSKEGEQEITIEAVDEYENKTTKAAKLIIKQDKEGPIFSGLDQININIGESIDYKKGVTAKDEKDGNVEFTVDSNGVNTGKVGNYEATYSAKDKSGNQTTIKRKIVVSEKKDPTAELYEKADAVISKVAGSGSLQQKVLNLVIYFKNESNLRYSHTYNEGNAGGWQNGARIALTKKTGDCYIHASVMKLMLERLGIPNYIVQCTDKSHAWNLIQINGVWRHVDSTPKVEHYPNELMTDSRRYETLQWLHPRDWNHSAYPAAN